MIAIGITVFLLAQVGDAGPSQGGIEFEEAEQEPLPAGAPDWIPSFLELPEHLMWYKYAHLSHTRRLDLALYERFFTVPPSTLFRKPILKEGKWVITELRRRLLAEADERVVVAILDLLADARCLYHTWRKEREVIEEIARAVARIRDVGWRLQAQRHVQRLSICK